MVTADFPWKGSDFSEAELEEMAILQALQAAVYVIDSHGRITFYNEAAAALWGRRPELGSDQWCGSWKLYRPDGTPLPHDQCPMAQALKEDRVIKGAEAVAERPDGTRVPFLAFPTPLHDGSGRLVGAVNMLVDISERKRLERNLRQTHEDLEDFFENSAMPLHLVAEDGTILRANKAELDLLGYTREEYVGHNIAEFYPDRAMIADILARLSRGEHLDKYEARLRAKNGAIKHILLTSNARLRDGDFVNTRCFSLDISERKQAEVMEQRLAAIVESSDDAIVSKDRAGIIQSWNPGAERLFGYKADEVIGKPITVLIPPDRQHEEAVILARIGRGERVDHYETVRQRKDGSLVDISLTVSPVRDGDGNIIGASKIARDITARKQAEEKTQILLHEIDHRGKNLLSTVHAVARMTQANSVPEFVDIFTGRLGALSRVHRVLAESRWRGADLRGLVDEELAAYGADTGWRVSISGTQTDLGAEAAQVLAMAIHELATNAAKYGAMSTPSGHVAVEWSWDSEGKLVLDWVETGGPTVSEPSHRGFGVTLIDRIISHQLRGTVHLDWCPEGLRCQMSIPREKLVARQP